jgi:hypothetical protein
MSLSLEQVRRAAELSRLRLSAAEEELFAEHRLSEVSVRVRKPSPPVSIPVEAAWAEVVRRV